ncbi:hypothetical protein DLAC_10365 [Tieghemostelium lacteum]|uniref:Uncharacterized protein n=1 Tax=Tieghemostelium lacteum TaxID=361077 RepID=A0A151Z5B5_TIELA|nr:hypothetical protein DLAC_10365 [Tieghemostelium lacteum]|eukprot:KYQ89125.1 hypothetical protein DLAC_10365 [Tieghemostelium lacteum]
MSRKIINQIIRNVVQQNSIPDGTIPSADAQFSLNRYFDDPNAVDIVYENMIERVKNEKTHYDQVLSRILKLIKNNIAIHPPSFQLLLDLDSFCVEIQPSLSLTLQKTVTYIRALISNQVKQQTRNSSNSNSSSSSGSQLENLSHVHKKSSSTGMTNVGSSSMNTSGGISIGTSVVGIRSRSLSSSIHNSVHNHKDEFLLQRTSIDLSNVLSTSNQSSSAGNSMIIGSILSTSSSSSSSSSPLSLNESPLKNSLTNTPLSPNLVSTNGTSLSTSSSNNPIINVIHNDQHINGSGSSSVVLRDSSTLLISSSNSLYRQDQDGFIRDLLLMKTSNLSKSSIPKYKIESLLTQSPFGVLTSAKESKIKDLFKCPNDSNNWDAINVAEISQVIRVIENPSTTQDRSIATKIFIKIILDTYCRATDSSELPQMESVVLGYFRQLFFPAPMQPNSVTRELRLHALNIVFNLGIHINIYSELKLDDPNGGEHGIIGELQESVFSILKDLLSDSIVILKEKDEKFWQEALNCLLFFITDQGNVIRDRLLKLNPKIIAYMLLYVQDIGDNVKRILVRMLCNILYVKNSLATTSATVVATGGNMNSTTVMHSLPHQTQVHGIPNTLPSSTLQYNSALHQQEYILNEEELTNIGGIEFIIRLYTTIRSNEAKNNLFAIIFDYALLIALKIANIVETQLTMESPILLELFRRADAPHYFTQMFKCLPDNFVSCFFVFNAGKNESSLSYEDLVIKFSMKIQTLADRYQKIDGTALEQQLNELLNQNPTNTDTINPIILDILNQEDDEQALLNVENWLFFNLRKLLFDQKDQNSQLVAATLLPQQQLSHNHVIYNYAHSIFVQLASSPSTTLRRMYISLTERLLLVSKYKFGQSKANETLEMFNENISRLLFNSSSSNSNSNNSNINSIGNEKYESNLLYLVDILFDLIYSKNINIGNSPINNHKNSNIHNNSNSSLNLSSNNSFNNSGPICHISNNTGNDTNFSLFLNNEFVVSISLLKMINIQIIQYLFTNITQSERTNDQRVFLLHLLIQRCSKDPEDLSRVGGIGFFKSLLNDTSTQVAYHSSYFLLTQLESESPEQYRSILTRLLSKARENNNENLISNPFFQVQGIIEMTLDPKNTKP